MTILHEELYSNNVDDDVLISLKMRESSPAYNMKINHQDQSLSKCYYFLSLNNNDAGDVRDSTETRNISALGEEVRSLIIQFLFNTVDQFGESRELVFVAIDYLDRFLLTRLRHDNENILPENIAIIGNGVKVLDLYVFAALGLAIKLFGPSSGSPKQLEERREVNSHLSPQENSKKNYLFLPSKAEVKASGYKSYGYNIFVPLTDAGGGDNSIAEGISKAEASILSTLQWYVHPPTSYQYIQTLLEKIPPGYDCSLWESLRDFAYYQSELALSNKDTNKYPSSVVAICAVSNSIHRHLINETCSSEGKEMIKNSLKKIIRQMETCLSLSLEYDERIMTLRALLTRQTLTAWKLHIENVRVQDRGKRNDGFNRVFPQKRKISYLEKLEQCFFLENIEGLLSRDAQTKQSSNVNTGCQEIMPINSGELESHYNKFIRPKLYSLNKT